MRISASQSPITNGKKVEHQIFLSFKFSTLQNNEQNSFSTNIRILRNSQSNFRVFAQNCLEI